MEGKKELGKGEIKGSNYAEVSISLLTRNDNFSSYIAYVMSNFRRVCSNN